MIYRILFFLFLVGTLHADSTRLAPEAEPLALVHGCVSLIKGEFIQRRTDLLIEGPSPLSLTRICDSGSAQAKSPLGLGFTWAIAKDLWRPGYTWDVCALEEREGIELYYRNVGTEASPRFEVDPGAFRVGYTSYSRGEISGVNNLHNVILTPRGGELQRYWDASRDAQSWLTGGEWVVTLGCGTQRIYSWKAQPERYWWQLSKEIRPDGNKVLYEYDQNNLLTKAILTDHSESIWISAYTIQYQKDEILAVGTNGQQVRFDKGALRFKLPGQTGQYFERLLRVAGDHLIPCQYGYYKSSAKGVHAGKLEWISQPDNHSLRIYYDQSGRVCGLDGPVGHDSALCSFATFAYDGKTREWRGPTGELTKYQLDHHDRVFSIERWNQGQPYSQMRYWWLTEGREAGNLKAYGLWDSSNHLIYSKQFTHDERGNVIREVLEGNLTGASSNEAYAIDRTFLPVFNVVTEEISGDGLKIECRYQEGTHLLTAKYKSTHQCFAREFFDYDRFANVTRHIADNGSGTAPEDLTDVIIRTITETEPVVVSLSPAFGKPQKVRKKYWENGQEHLLSLIEYRYDERGHPTQEEIYDADGHYRYSLYFRYDPAGRLLEQTDALGHKTLHSYDKNGNRIVSQDLATGLSTEYLYDLANRLIKETAHHPHRSYETSHRYDKSSRRIATTDPHGQTTYFTHDDLGRVISTTQTSSDGVSRTEKSTYDPAGNQTSSQDALGRTTRTSYTARGQPIQITYPDNSSERYQYNSNGSLCRHTAVNGVTTEIYYDQWLQPAGKAFFDAQGKYLYSTSATYRGELLLAETDGNGIETHYRYDGAGRLIETRKGNQRTTFAFDSLGRQHKTSEWVDADTARVSTREYDNLGRVIEECIEDHSLTHSSLLNSRKFAYDRCGNCCLQTTETSQGLAQTRTEYDSRHRPILQIDALGHMTHIEYDENFTQGILRTIVTDPLGNQTITTQNSIGQVTEQTRKDPLGTLTARSCYSYDLAGHKTEQIDTAIAPNLPSRTIITEWIYDSMGRVIALTEAKDTPEQKCTSYSYNERGQKETIYLPDGTSLHHTYDGLGRLQRYSASDQTFAYSYQYDLNNNVHTVTDELTQLATLREYDPHNRIIHETLANGLSLSYTYDGLNRPLKVILPDQTYVEYTYDACQLKTVSRPERSYEHHYTSYDLSGALLEELSPIGEIAYTWDLLNRPRSIQSSYFTETIPEEGYDAVGNLLNKTRKDPDRITHCRYSYDALYQLKSETITGFDAHEYTYDSLYNRRLRDNKEHTINHLNQLLSVEETSYTYDKRGNLIAETTPTSHTEYRYDALGRLTSLSRNGINYTYQYDAFNRRLQKTSDQTTERYIYAGQNEIGLVNEQGKITQLRILGSGKEAEIGSAIALELDDQIYIPLNDHCGHVSVLVDLATKQFAEAYVYSAFGEEQRYGPGTTNPWHFSSKRYDPEAYMGSRDLESCSMEERSDFMASVSHSHARQEDMIDGHVQQQPAIDPTNSTYQNSRYMTNVGLTVVTLAYGAYGIAKGLWCAGRALIYGAGEATVATKTAAHASSKPRARPAVTPNKTLFAKGGCPRDPITQNYLPDPNALGSPHRGRTDVTFHGRCDHFSPHFRPALSPNSVETGAHPLLDFSSDLFFRYMHDS